MKASFTRVELAKAFGVDVRTIHRWLARLGAKRGPAGRGRVLLSDLARTEEGARLVEALRLRRELATGAEPPRWPRRSETRS